MGRGLADALGCLHTLDSGPNVEYIYSAQVFAHAAVKLFTNCEGTTVSYFFLTLSIYVFITLEISYVIISIK